MISDSEWYAKQRRFIQEFVSRLPRPRGRAERDPLVQFIDTCETCRKMLWAAKQVALRRATSDDAVDPDAVTAAVVEFYEPRIKRARNLVLARAREAGLVDEFLPLMEEATAGLREFHRWLDADVLEFCKPMAANGGHNPLHLAESVVRRALDQLRGRGVLLPPLRCPLTPLLRKVWDALKNRARTCPQLAKELMNSRTKEDAIRKRITAIRNRGWCIEHVAGLGFYRSDAPPPEMDSAAQESG